MRKKQLCNDIITGRILLATVTSKDGDLLTITGDPEDVTDNALKAVMAYMQERCESENRKEIAFKIPGRGELGVGEETTAEPADELLEGCGRSALWPTPKCQNRNSPCKHGDGGPDLQTVCSGQLNPDWVEPLMGFPEGWTNPDVDEPEPWRGWPAPMGMELYPTPCGIGNGGKGGDGELSHMVRNGTKQRLWMTPRSATCGMTARTSGRTLEKSTHLETQVHCADVKLWGTPNAADCQGSHGGGQGKSLRTDISDIKHGAKADQHPYEFPRTVKGGKFRAERLKCLGNAVVPQQAYPFFRAIAVLSEIANQEVD